MESEQHQLRIFGATKRITTRNKFQSSRTNHLALFCMTCSNMLHDKSRSLKPLTLLLTL
jgi:hypothetical protein